MGAGCMSDTSAATRVLSTVYACLLYVTRLLEVVAGLVGVLLDAARRCRRPGGPQERQIEHLQCRFYLQELDARSPPSNSMSLECAKVAWWWCCCRRGEAVSSQTCAKAHHRAI